ncbi:MAG: hypothetical protein QM755_23820 [Luteolibacter sp.]
MTPLKTTAPEISLSCISQQLMNWLNLNTAVLDSPEFLGSDTIERGTWLCLLRYCAGQENGGRIIDCKQWSDRKWQQLVRVTLKEVRRACDLWKWEGDDLVVFEYPADKEAEVREKRDTAKTNGRRGGRPRKTNVGTETETHEKPTLVISEKAEGERKEKGKEGEGERESVSASTSPHVHHEPKRPTLQQAKAAAQTIGIPPEKAEEWWNAREASGWIKGAAGGGTTPVGSNWQADLTTYARRPIGGNQHGFGNRPNKSSTTNLGPADIP